MNIVIVISNVAVTVDDTEIIYRQFTGNQAPKQQLFHEVGSK